MIKLLTPDGKIVLKQYTPKTNSGIIEVPTGEKEQSRVGIVYDFGKPRKEDPQLTLKVGQKIIFKKYVSNSLYVPEFDEKFDFIEYDDVCAVMLEEE